MGPCNEKMRGEKGEVQLLHLTLDWENRLKPKINNKLKYSNFHYIIKVVILYYILYQQQIFIQIEH